MNLRTFLVLVIGIFILGSKSFAASFYLAHSTDVLVPILLYVPDGETPERMINKYFQNMQSNSDMVDLYQGRAQPIDFYSFTPIEYQELKKRAVLIANHPNHYRLNSDRVQGFKQAFASQKTQTVMIPFSYDLTLSLNNKREFHSLVANHVSLLVSMGGQDVTTTLYSQPDIHARDTNLTRDLSEKALISEFIRVGKGFFLGVCRGSQLAAVTMGYKLIQDLPAQKGTQIIHAEPHSHLVTLRPTTHNIFSSMFPGYSQIMVNSIHHQAVVYRPGGPLELAAVAPDGTVEATEFKNGKGLLLQFHPELFLTSHSLPASVKKLGPHILASVLFKARNLSSGPKCHRVWLSAK